MNASVSQTTLTTLLDKLETFLTATGKQLAPERALALAVDAWLLAQSAATRPASPAMPAEPECRGYQWKSLFLPHDTQLRMRHGEDNFYARVVGDDIIYQGRSVSPRGMTMAIAGDGRNAWRDLWLRMPGDAKWQCATVRRNAIKRAEVAQTQSPADTIAGVAASMSTALTTVLALIDRIKKQSFEQPERRTERFRRATDDLLDYGPVDPPEHRLRS